MIRRGAAIIIAALGAIGLGAAPPVTREDLEPIMRPSPMRKARLDSEPAKGTTTKPRGRRCSFCGTGGHERRSAHGRGR